MSAGLVLECVSVRLGDRPVLHDVSFACRPGEMVGLLGPNGAGKTTAVRALMGLLPLSSGRAALDGQDPACLSPVERARRVAYLPQARPLAWPLSVRDTVALGRFAYGTATGRLSTADQDAIDRALSATSLTALAERTTNSLSGGELARVHVARALAADVKLVIADEPTASLDPRHAFAVLQVLKAHAEGGGATLVILHDLALAARFCDRVVVMAAGRVVADGPPKAALSPDLLSDVYGVRGALHDGALRLDGLVGSS